MIAPTNAIAGALLILFAMTGAGLLHLIWLSSKTAQRFNLPIDGGRCWRGRRIFGPNKTWRGFCVLPWAGALCFALLDYLIPWLPAWWRAGWWNFTLLQAAMLGFACGLVFMLAELPNSLIKRQLDIPAGGPAPSSGLKIFFAILDRYDSSLGVVLLIALCLPVPAMTLVWVLVFGPTVHALCSILQFQLGLKGRAL